MEPAAVSHRPAEARARPVALSRPAGLVLVAWLTACAAALASPSAISWHYFRDGAHWLTSVDGLHVYAAHPTLQIGPLSLLVAAAVGAVAAAHATGTAQVLATGLALPVLWALADLARSPAHRRPVALLVAGGLTAWAWSVMSVRWLHLDDALALAGLALLLPAVRRHRPLLAGLLLAGAIAAKPWAVIGLPLLLLLPARRDRLAALAVTIAGTVSAWLPFVVADPGTLSALRPDVGMSDTSVLWLLGLHAAVVPGWVRTAQLLLAPAVALGVVLRGKWPLALLAGLAVRLVLDPQDIGYYAAGVVLAAAIADLATHRRFPWLTLATAAVWWQPFVTDYARRMTSAHGLSRWWFQHPSAVGTLHLAWCVAVVVWALMPAVAPAVGPVDDQRPMRRFRWAYARMARRKSTRRKSGQYASQK